MSSQKHKLSIKERVQFKQSFRAFVTEQCERFSVCPLDILCEIARYIKEAQK